MRCSSSSSRNPERKLFSSLFVWSLLTGSRLTPSVKADECRKDWILQELIQEKFLTINLFCFLRRSSRLNLFPQRNDVDLRSEPCKHLCQYGQNFGLWNTAAPPALLKVISSKSIGRRQSTQLLRGSHKSLGCEKYYAFRTLCNAEHLSHTVLLFFFFSSWNELLCKTETLAELELFPSLLRGHLK